MGDQYDPDQFEPVPAAKCPACGALVVTGDKDEAMDHLRGCSTNPLGVSPLAAAALINRLGIEEERSKREEFLYGSSNVGRVADNLDAMRTFTGFSVSFTTGPEVDAEDIVDELSGDEEDEEE